MYFSRVTIIYSVHEAKQLPIKSDNVKEFFVFADGNDGVKSDKP